MFISVQFSIVQFSTVVRSTVQFSSRQQSILQSIAPTPHLQHQVLVQAATSTSQLFDIALAVNTLNSTIPRITLYSIVHWCTLVYITVQYSTGLCNVQHCTLVNTVQTCALLYTVQSCTVYTTVPFTKLHFLLSWLQEATECTTIPVKFIQTVML